MKKKTTTYILLAVVAAIWGIVIFKVFNYATDDSLQDTSYMPMIQKDTLQREKYDTIPLQLNYSDPFLKRSTMSTPIVKQEQPKEKVQSKPEPPKPVPVIKERVFWPQIQYDGTIGSKGASLAMMKINGQSFIVAKGKSEKEVTVKKIYQDSILVIYKHEEKVFYKK